MQRTEIKLGTIFTIGNFFSPEECQRHIQWSEKRGYKEAKINSLGRQVVVPEVRNNSRILFKDEALANDIWQRVQPYCVQQFGFMQAIGLNEMFRLLPSLLPRLSFFTY